MAGSPTTFSASQTQWDTLGTGEKQKEKIESTESSRPRWRRCRRANGADEVFVLTSLAQVMCAPRAKTRRESGGRRFMAPSRNGCEFRASFYSRFATSRAFGLLRHSRGTLSSGTEWAFSKKSSPHARALFKQRRMLELRLMDQDLGRPWVHGSGGSFQEEDLQFLFGLLHRCGTVTGY